MQPIRRLALLAFTSCALGASFQACVFTDPVEDCTNEQACGGPHGGSGGGGHGGGGGVTGGGGLGGTGGTDPCGGCGGATPYCDAVNGVCEACLEHEHCTEAGAAQCDGGDCVACSAPEHCAGVADAGICEGGTCVECTVNDDSACSTVETCNLVDYVCVGVQTGAVGNCEACTNDEQCGSGFRCIAMEFGGNPHGHYCLEEDTGSNCIRPFTPNINRSSINGAAAADYCAVEESLATCEAVLALLNGWVCSGPDESCGPVNQPEEPVPGALCRNIGGEDICTYACAHNTHCLPSAYNPLDVCAGGAGGSSPDYCGG